MKPYKVLEGETIYQISESLYRWLNRYMKHKRGPYRRKMGGKSKRVG